MKRAYPFRIAAATVLGLMVLFWLLTSIRGMMAGVHGEIYNLIIIFIVIILSLLAWKRLLLGGLLLCGFGVILAMYFFLLPTDLQTITPQLLFMCIPMTIAGLLFIEADWHSKKRIN
jgi:predicted outer membrane lipoprotein